MACIKAAMAMVSSTVMGISQMRISMVGKKGWTLMSHHIFLALSIQLVFTSKFKKVFIFSKAAKKSGIPVRGNLSNTFERYDLNPVLRPSQKGELVESAYKMREEISK